MTEERFKELLNNDEIQVFPIGSESVMVGRIFDDVVELMAAAGNLREVLRYEPEFCAWYYSRDFHKFITGGRFGWKRFLPDLGWIPIPDEKDWWMKGT